MENDVVIQQKRNVLHVLQELFVNDGDLLCVNIPCTTTVVLLGIIRLTLGPVCLRVGAVGDSDLANLTDEEKLAQVQQVFGVLKNAVPNFTAEELRKTILNKLKLKKVG